MRRSKQAIAKVWPLPLLMPLTILVTMTAALGPESYDRVVIGMLINLILVIGLYVFLGVSGVFSFGHMAFMAIGAYTAALLTIPTSLKTILLPELPGFLADLHLSTVAAILVAGGVAAVVAALLAFPLTRLSGLMAGLATFAILVIVYVVARNWEQVTNGTTGMTAVPVATNRTNALVWALVAMTIAYLFQQSRVGLRLRASREDEFAAKASGISVVRERGLAFVLSAFIVGIGGALFAQFIGSFNPDAFFLDITFLTIAMLVIGGTKALSGAVVGTIVVSAVSEGLRQIEQGVAVFGVSISTPPGLRQVGLAAAMLAVLLVRPKGITGGRELRWPLREAIPAAGQSGSAASRQGQAARRLARLQPLKRRSKSRSP